MIIKEKLTKAPAPEFSSPKRRRWLLPAVLIVVAAVLLVRYVPLNFLPPDESAFSLTSDTVLQTTMKVGESQTISARLAFSPFRSFVATGGNSLVYIHIEKVGEPIGYAGVGRYAYLPAGGSASAETVFAPTEPGDYLIYIASDSFSIGGNRYKPSLTTQCIHVSE